MANKNYFDTEISTLLESFYKMCDNLDKVDLGISNYYPDDSSRNMLSLSFNLFNIYIANADGVLDDAEVKLICKIGDVNFSKDDIEKIIPNTDIDKDSFAESVPVILRAFVDVDNSNVLPKGESQAAASFYHLLALSGTYIMLANDEIDSEEFNHLEKYLNTVYSFIKKNLKYAFVDIKKPEDLIRSILDDVEIDADKTIKRKPKSNDKSKVQAESEKDEAEEKELEELLDELNSMIGLDEVKYEVTSLMNLLRVKLLREEMGLQMPPISMHLVFSGNPGTGKTTVARLLSKIYKKIGILSKGHLVEVDRSGLVGGYVGQTALKGNDVIENALGGVLFIDEAYSLAPADSSNDYGYEAIDILVKGMEDNRKDLVVIVAGYPEPMERFLNANPGLRSRFNKFIYFRDYTADELVQIFKQLCSKNGYRPTKPALEYVQSYFADRCAHKEKNFANAREVRNLFELAISRQANRVMLIVNPTKENLTLLRSEDIKGEDVDLGKQQYLAQKIMNDLNREKRYGIDIELMGMRLDELEISASAENAFLDSEIYTIGDFLDMKDGKKDIKEDNVINSDVYQELEEALVGVGYTQLNE